MRTSAVVIDEAPDAGGLALPPGEYVSIVVQDTGVGISKELVKRIFEAFHTTKGEGTGLGLAVVMSIVEKLGGEVRVESTPGEGSSFTVFLPHDVHMPNLQIDGPVEVKKVVIKVRL